MFTVSECYPHRSGAAALLAWLAAVLVVQPCPARAQDLLPPDTATGILPAAAATPADVTAPAWKFTAGRYQYSAGSPGTDLNLRYSQDDAHAWVGNFRQPGEAIRQWRAGWDQSFFETVRVQPSLQVASGGFAGGSLGLETGEHVFVGAGLGRTNLRPYYNLNCDPNESYTLSAGWRGDHGASASLLWVRDNRLNPDQRHLHGLTQVRLPEGQRISLDVLYKQGLVDARMVHRLGATVTCDWPAWFLRLAFDPRTNFTPVDAWRLSVGTRF